MLGAFGRTRPFRRDDITLSPSDITVNKDSNADFLVGLSALSSTSNLTSTSSKPLDIVLVLDTSGSMEYDFGTASYVPTYESERRMAFFKVVRTSLLLTGNTFVSKRRRISTGTRLTTGAISTSHGS